VAYPHFSFTRGQVRTPARVLYYNQWQNAATLVGGNEKQWGSGRGRMLGNGLGPWHRIM
jgi:hypothetical protein